MVKLVRRQAQSFFANAIAALGFSVFLVSLIDVLGEKPIPVWMVFTSLALLVTPFSVKVPGIDERNLRR
jgi:hypothetical protein